MVGTSNLGSWKSHWSLRTRSGCVAMGREQGGQPYVRCLVLRQMLKKHRTVGVKVVVLVAAVYGDAASLLGLLAWLPHRRPSTCNFEVTTEANAKAVTGCTGTTLQEEQSKITAKSKLYWHQPFLFLKIFQETLKPACVKCGTLGKVRTATGNWPLMKKLCMNTQHVLPQSSASLLGNLNALSAFKTFEQLQEKPM